MSRNLNELTIRDEDGIDADRSDFFHALFGIVAVNDDPEFQHRIKCVFPWHDADRVHDEWIKRLVWWTGSPGYGDFHPPELGSEVFVFGALGQKYHLAYLSVYNERNIVPADFRSPSVRGFRTDGDYKMHADLDMSIRAGRLDIESLFSTIRLTAPGGVFIGDRRIG